MAEAETIVVNVDVSGFRREAAEAERQARGFGRALGDALESGVVQGRSLGEVLRGLAGRLSGLALSAALRPVENALGGLFSSLTRSALGAVAPVAAEGGLAAPAGLTAGVISRAAAARPAPNSAVEKSVDARSGASAAAGHGPVTVNIATPDIEGFRRSEAQVTASLARAVARGRRGL